MTTAELSSEPFAVEIASGSVAPIDTVVSPVTDAWTCSPSVRGGCVSLSRLHAKVVSAAKARNESAAARDVSRREKCCQTRMFNGGGDNDAGQPPVCGQGRRPIIRRER